MKRFSAQITIDRPIGEAHPAHPDVIYPINYGYIEGLTAGDGEALDVYILGETEPLTSFFGEIIAVIKRFDDVEDKWVAAKSGASYSADQIERAVRFQEQFHAHRVELIENL